MGLQAGDSMGYELIRNGKAILRHKAGDPDFGNPNDLGQGSNHGSDELHVTKHGDLIESRVTPNQILVPKTLKDVLDHTKPMDMRGKWNWELWRRIDQHRPDSPLRPILIGETPNLIVDGGKLHILDVEFNSGTQILQTSWYAGAISLASFSAIAAADTMASHAGWTEFTNYSQSTRPAWGPGAPTNSGGVAITNASPITFNFTAGGTIKGLFITSNNTKGGSTGTLWAAALFIGGDVPVVNGDELRSTYTVNM